MFIIYSLAEMRKAQRMGAEIQDGMNIRRRHHHPPEEETALADG
jgi:hypothetical protein